MSINKDHLHEILTYVAAKCGMKNWRYKIDEESETIHTFFCVLIPLKLIEVSNGKENTHHVYVKLPPMDETIIALTDFLWDSEVYFYKNFVPLWKRISNFNIDELIPECYSADATKNHLNIIVKNMSYEKFQSYKETFLDFDHVRVSLKSLAQFHALSFIIRNDHDQSVFNILKPYTDIFPLNYNLSIIQSFRTHAQLFKGSKYENFWKETLANYKIVVENATSKAKCLLYGHGDYWKENILFKYENNIPVKACLIDFQGCRLLSPAYDFLYFVLNSTKGSLRRLHYHTFLTEYYECFKNTLFDHGIQLDAYQKEDFLSDCKIVAPLCFIRICLAFSLWLGFETDAVVKSKISWENEQERDKHMHYFKQILIDGMEDLCMYGYISL